MNRVLLTLILICIVTAILPTISKKMNLIENIHNSLIFYPSKEIYSSPAQDGIKHKEVYIKTTDGEKLHGYFIPSPNEKTNKTIIYLHGNAENVTTWYQAPVEIQKHVPVNALIVDYRGYGKSTGKPSIAGVISDALAMYEYLLNEGYKGEDISIYGRSIGGAIGLELASKVKVKSIVVQSSFTSLLDIAKELYPFLPKILISNDYWNSKELIKKINCPVLISHGDKDEIVSVSHSYELYKVAKEPKQIIILNGASHNDINIYFNDEYYKSLSKIFL